MDENKLAKVSWEEGRIAVLSHTYAVKSPLVTMAPQICPQKYPFPWIDPLTPLPASPLELYDLWCQITSGSDPLLFHNALDRHTDRRKDAPTDRSSTGKFDDYRPLHYESDVA